MKLSTRIKVLLISLGITFIATVLYQVAMRTDRIDIISMTNNEHVFGYITNTKIAPHKTITIPLVTVSNGKKNYVGDPSATTFAKYLAIAYDDTSQLNIEAYTKFINSNK